MTSKYRVEYALKSHRRDQLIEWIKGLLAVPFVLHCQPSAAAVVTTAVSATTVSVVNSMAAALRSRYAEIMGDVEELIADHMVHQAALTAASGSSTPTRGANSVRASSSKLKLLVPSVGTFFTPLLLREAFNFQDERRRISYRRFVPPSFNDIRLIMNSAQVMALVRGSTLGTGSSRTAGRELGGSPLRLVTFDGDVTLYDDGQSLLENNPVIPRLLALLASGIAVGIVTAAGYTEAEKYYDRLAGLLQAVRAAVEAGTLTNPRVVVVGGESSYLFEFNAKAEHLLVQIDRSEWELPEMRLWDMRDMQALLDVAEAALKECITNLDLDAQIIRKDRAVGIIPSDKPNAKRFAREQLEETVLVVQQLLEMSPAGQRVPFCAFNGGNDVFVDIGDKRYGVRACQNYLGERSRAIDGRSTLHVGDQFLSAGANDFKARLACTTAWIASPAETVTLLDELVYHRDREHERVKSFENEIQASVTRRLDPNEPSFFDVKRPR